MLRVQSITGASVIYHMRNIPPYAIKDHTQKHTHMGRWIPRGKLMSTGGIREGKEAYRRDFPEKVVTTTRPRFAAAASTLQGSCPHAFDCRTSRVHVSSEDVTSSIPLQQRCGLSGFYWQAVNIYSVFRNMQTLGFSTTMVQSTTTILLRRRTKWRLWSLQTFDIVLSLKYHSAD